jgi:hypothetical protein
MNDYKRYKMSTKTDSALQTLDIARTLVPSGSKWQHYKGGVYEVVGHAIDTDDGSARIRYRRLAGPGFNPWKERTIEFVRPITEWTNYRFTPIDSGWSDPNQWQCMACGKLKSEGCGGPDRLVPVPYPSGVKLVRPACPMKYIGPSLTARWRRFIRLLWLRPG